MSDDRETRVVLSTLPDREAAERLVKALVEERLAACGNIVPGLSSIFRWEGAVEEATEVLVVLKTAAATLPALLERAPELHPYDVPEFIALPITAGHRPYLEWVVDESSG